MTYTKDKRELLTTGLEAYKKDQNSLMECIYGFVCVCVCTLHQLIQASPEVEVKFKGNPKGILLKGGNTETCLP